MYQKIVLFTLERVIALSFSKAATDAARARYGITVSIASSLQESVKAQAEVVGSSIDVLSQRTMSRI